MLQFIAGYLVGRSGRETTTDRGADSGSFDAAYCAGMLFAFCLLITAAPPMVYNMIHGDAQDRRWESECRTEAEQTRGQAIAELSIDTEIVDAEIVFVDQTKAMSYDVWWAFDGDWTDNSDWIRRWSHKDKYSDAQLAQSAYTTALSVDANTLSGAAVSWTQDGLFGIGKLDRQYWLIDLDGDADWDLAIQSTDVHKELDLSLSTEELEQDEDLTVIRLEDWTGNSKKVKKLF